MTPQVLATDLDGTLIPLDGNAQNVNDLIRISEHLSQCGMQMLYVTGRHLASIQGVMQEMSLPQPDWIIGDVGTSIYRREVPKEAGHYIAPATSSETINSYTLDSSYVSHLHDLVGDFTVDRLAAGLESIGELRRQEPEKQTRFKLSYYVAHVRLSVATQQIEQRVVGMQAPYTVVASRDPFNGDGLIDLLPRKVTKAHAIGWWAEQQSIDRQAILYAGDSGNDSAVFAAGYRSIIVANANSEVLQAAQIAHAKEGWNDRIFAAPAPATSGVLSGLKHYGLFPLAKR
ncbi:MAG: HAD-IIB family hydrolase [Aureliella sp.]